MAKQDAGVCLKDYVPDYTLFDLETTGLSREKDEIVEISAVKVRNGEVVDEFSTLVNPGMPMPLDAMLINNITDSMLRDAPSIKKVLPAFFRFVGSDILVGHNIHAFDMPFIRRDCEKYFGKTPPNNYIDTLQYAKAVLPEQKKFNLAFLSDFFGIPVEGAHRALNDCRMNQQVFERLHEVRLLSGESERVEEIRICPDCGARMVKRKGAYGEFFGCGAYPNCRHTEKIR